MAQTEFTVYPSHDNDHIIIELDPGYWVFIHAHAVHSRHVWDEYDADDWTVEGDFQEMIDLMKENIFDVMALIKIVREHTPFILELD